MYSLDECHQTYLKKLMQQNTKMQKKKEGQIIDQNNIVQMQKIYYFQTKPSETNDYIFAKSSPKEIKGKHLMNHSGSEAENSYTTLECNIYIC